MRIALFTLLVLAAGCSRTGEVARTAVTPWSPPKGAEYYAQQDDGDFFLQPIRPPATSDTQRNHDITCKCTLPWHRFFDPYGLNPESDRVPALPVPPL